ncbi:MAG: cytochrome c biogenesis protein CcsA [Kofleriaceae bacterium]|nr:cytochrome c biogenesis protein CcsA [Kofleriaceae bacterium]
MKRAAVPLLSVLAAVGLVVAVWGVFVRAPLQVNTDPLGNVIGGLFFNQKIFYFHVAHAFMLFLGVFVCGIASVGYLKQRDPRWDDVALAAAEVAAVFGLVVLVTGSIWAKAAWDIWWSWEKRLTMSLLLWLTLVGYVMVRRFAGLGSERMAAGLAVFASVLIPFIYIMVDKSDRHPQAGSKGNVATLDPAMKPWFWLSVVTFLCWFLLLMISRVGAARAERQLRELRERGLDAGVLT